MYGNFFAGARDANDRRGAAHLGDMFAVVVSDYVILAVAIAHAKGCAIVGDYHQFIVAGTSSAPSPI